MGDSSPTLYITGLPNSGTTYVAHLLWKAGCDFGPENLLWPHGHRRKGMEWKPLREYNVELVRRLTGDVEPKGPGFTLIDEDKRLRHLAEQPPPLPTPDMVKVPDYGITRLYEWYQPDTVLVVRRDVRMWAASMLHWRPLSGRFTAAQLIEDGLRASERMKGREVWFPKVVDDPGYMTEALSGFAGEDRLRWAHEEITRPNWVTKR